MDSCVDCVHYLVCKYFDCDPFQCRQFKHYENTEEVVRCKDCKRGREFSIDRCECSIDGELWGKDDFCSYGERRTDDST